MSFSHYIANKEKITIGAVVLHAVVTKQTVEIDTEKR